MGEANILPEVFYPIKTMMELDSDSMGALEVLPVIGQAVSSAEREHALNAWLTWFSQSNYRKVENQHPSFT